jgi:hypothetical protein
MHLKSKGCVEKVRLPVRSDRAKSDIGEYNLISQQTFQSIGNNPGQKQSYENAVKMIRQSLDKEKSDRNSNMVTHKPKQFNTGTQSSILKNSGTESTRSKLFSSVSVHDEMKKQTQAANKRYNQTVLE